MRVLIACEFSGVVRDAFLALGHDAVSCDLLATERPGPHIIGDAGALLAQGWDLMIAHPPCTCPAAGGLRYPKDTKATCLWLKGLAPLTPSAIVDGRAPVCHRQPQSKERWRSRTYTGIAAAMAAQWGLPRGDEGRTVGV